MSDFASRLRVGTLLSRAGSAGPRRFILMGVGTMVVAAAIVYVSMSGSQSQPQSRVAPLPIMNPLPGGLASNPQQDKLALLTNQQQADQAARQGQSYTPPIAASQPVAPPAPAALPEPFPPSSTPAAPTTRPAAPPQPLHYVPPFPVQQAAQTTTSDPREQQLYSNAVNNLLRGWDGQPPKTDVLLQSSPEGTRGTGESAAGGAGASGSADGRLDGGSYADRSGAPAGQLLVPAGRGVFAHTVLAASSDSEGPVVLQADSGPLAGDRMIGSFGKATSNGAGSADRLVVRINSLEHDGQTIAVDGIVTAPDTMETTVASRVDEHYVARFVLPAAASFIQGLGQALATTSNTNGVLSPLGGTSFSTQLNFPQQLGVGAGVAAQQIGNTLNQQAPRGPTVYLDANSNVGVMFLADVKTSGNP